MEGSNLVRRLWYERRPQRFEKSRVEVFFISASLDVIVDAAGEYLGVDDARQGSPLEVRDGAYTGQVESIYSLKAPVVRAWLGALPMLAFGDSARSDFRLWRRQPVRPL